jgi:hypothetical protein
MNGLFVNIITHFNIFISIFFAYSFKILKTTLLLRHITHAKIYKDQDKFDNDLTFYDII